MFLKNMMTKLFFYHETIKINNFSFIKPGWCLINNKVSFLDILRALEIQKKIINKFNYSIPNLGIIKKVIRPWSNLQKKLKLGNNPSRTKKFIRFYVRI